MFHYINHHYMRSDFFLASLKENMIFFSSYVDIVVYKKGDTELKFMSGTTIGFLRYVFMYFCPLYYESSNKVV